MKISISILEIDVYYLWLFQYSFFNISVNTELLFYDNPNKVTYQERAKLH